jgi:Raf kinase inhibitor-like YbhB/YbcL family protein
MAARDVSRRVLLSTGAAAGLALAAQRAASAQATPAADLADPYARLPPVPSFTVSSADVRDGELMAKAQMSGIAGAGGMDASPHLSWNGFPVETKSFAVTLFDPDAPSPSGFWHWAVAGISGDVTELPAGAGDPDNAKLPAGAFQLPNDLRLARYVGAAPPKPQTHRYVFAVHALSVATLQIDPQSTPGLLSAMIAGVTVARALIVPLAKS